MYDLGNGMVLTRPRLGDPINDDYSYVKRASSENQARGWNERIKHYPELHPDTTGLEVGIAPMQVDRRWQLVWVNAPAQDR